MPDSDSTAMDIDRAVALRVGGIAELRKMLTNTTLPHHRQAGGSRTTSDR